LAGLSLMTKSFAADSTGAVRLSDYVRPFVGAQGEGNTFPGPSAPFGMIQISPDTDTTNWNTDSGYEYTDPTIMGFSLTHLSGTGCPDLGDFLFMPQVGEPAFVSGGKDKPEEGYQSAFSHADESASAGYYKVKLQKSGVVTELTAGERAGILRFTFPASDEASILTDLNHVINGGRWRVAESRLRIEDGSTITGFHLVNGWAKERYLYFAARYSRPFDEGAIISNGKPVTYKSYVNYRFRSRNEAAGTNLQFLAKFKTHADEVIQVKVAISAVSAANALQNLDAEIPDWDFDKLREATRAKWDQELSRIQIEGSEEQKATFYTSLYHAFLTPNLYQDVNGEYRGFDQNIHRANGFTDYTVFSLWDTFRAEHPLLALIQEPRDADMINSLLAHYDQSVDHLLPMWELQGNETWCMIGYHAAPVIADGFLKGVKGFDAERAYEAIKTTAMNPDYDGLAAYRKLGWVPCDEEDESLSKTLEYAYDDYSIAQMAQALGKTDDYNYFMKRAGSYKNIYDPSIGWMRSKNADGSWRTNFDAHLFGGGTNLQDVTEGTSSQYSWFVPQDVPGLIALMGGKEKFLEKLDSLFDAKQSEKFASELSANDLRGCIGEYWHGNEPAHHVIYLYCYAGQPWKAAEKLHQVVTTQYGSGPGSLCGNDDCGQMSAWYMFTCMGFYPVCPASGYYVIGAPQIPKAVMHLSNGKDFTMTAENISDQNIYVQSVKLNGKDWNSPFLPYGELKNGGKIEFVMGPQPNKSWGVNAEITAEDMNHPMPTATVSDEFHFKTADGQCEITINTAAATNLTEWADTKLASTLAEWYPKITALLPSDGYTAPAHFAITIKPMDGVAYTAGRNVVANSTWLAHELKGEAVGSLVHEAVHVVQQFHSRHNPGWLVEGSADYVRWFKYEPQSHGADMTWFRRHGKNFSPHYNDSYRITANFLNWVSEKYDKDIVTQMNVAMREGKYDESLWQKYTGKPLSELGAEWEKEVQTQLAG
jgi:predicted alpha-1,2-mannosidase